MFRSKRVISKWQFCIGPDIIMGWYPCTIKRNNLVSAETRISLWFPDHIDFTEKNTNISGPAIAGHFFTPRYSRDTPRAKKGDNNILFFNLSATLGNLHLLQFENCDSNSRLVVGLDEDDNGKFKLEMDNACPVRMGDYGFLNGFFGTFVSM